MSISVKNLIRITSIASFLGLTNIIIVSPTQAYSVTFSNGDFEEPVDFSNGFGDGWEGAGNISLQGTYSSVAPYNANQAVITTACPNTIQTGECLDDDGDTLPRNDDSPTPVGTFNVSGEDQISASLENTNNLQSILGLSDNAFSIYRKIGGVTYDGTNGNPVLRRTPKEGSAIYQDITIGNDGDPIDFFIKFNWDFLTNDGAGDLGNKDYGFISITSSSGYEQVFVLEDSTGNIPTLDSNDTDFATNTDPYAAYTSSNLTLTPGTYRVGFGVIDVDGVSNSSALLVDNFNVQQVPFEFSPTLGLFIIGGLFGCGRLRSRFQSNNSIEIEQIDN
ncbi:hypothetical protein Sta7437_4111 [Stanieria cyanosphaera PCC 7437]|uniref:Uncharacterized protein n=1 Tax=Stanieria cyanosphaera (strain ATCC 29371 / PCC 7437) TaxID=111780 RepID=K9XYK4_STAC7|nr:hypothetical protein [Stanieria cyanosphaera]AFZ37588.1 hypothetical protein Sta7437_4111 [Stanieria cyanosphaera PCC 7437]